MIRLPLAAISASIMVAAAALAGQASAADGIIVTPKPGITTAVPQSYVVVPRASIVHPQSPVIIWDEEYTRESQVVLVDPQGRSFRTTARFRPDGTMILPPDSSALPAGTILHQPAPVARYEQVYKVYDCGIINSNEEWDACGEQPQQ